MGINFFGVGHENWGKTAFRGLAGLLSVLRAEKNASFPSENKTTTDSSLLVQTLFLKEMSGFVCPELRGAQTNFLNFKVQLMLF